MRMHSSAPLGALFATALLGGCPEPPVAVDLTDDPQAYIDSAPYRRGVLERDLTELGNSYAGQRLALYGLGDGGWDALPAVDRRSRALRDADRDALANDEPLVPGEMTTLAPDGLPSSESEWIALGRRVFFEYPLRADPTYQALAGLNDGLEVTGFLRDSEGGWVGLRVFEDDTGALRVGNTCAQCHASYEGRAEPQLDGVLSNRAMDIGAARLLVLGLVPGDLPPEQESTSIGDLDRLGPGRADVLPDEAFNPYAFPDFGGLGDMPLLHHNANWTQAGVATLAVRCETLFITSSLQRTRIPRVLSWALAMWQRSLPPPAPRTAPSTNPRGEQVFTEAGCAGCHVPPLFTSDGPVPVESIGTDPSAGLSAVRFTGNYRVPSLRGVARSAPYLHDGSVPDLETFLDPDREATGHEYGLDLGAADRQALLEFLDGI